MLRFLAKRFLQLIPTFIGATLLAFLIIQLTPGDFTDRFALDPNADATQLQRLKENFGLEQPVFVQYLRWV